jgi:predicted peptidase
MVICLHGGAGWGTDNVKQVNGSLPAVMLSNYLIREQHPAFLFVPQISGAYSFGGLPNLKVADDIILEAIQSLDSRFKIDKSRFYVAGNSLGAYGVWHFIGKYPNTFAAAIPISGEGDIDKAPEMINTAVWAFHGKKDINVPVSGSREMIRAIRLAGGNPLYTEYPDADHDIWKKVINTPGLVDWLFSKQKNNPHK